MTAECGVAAAVIVVVEPFAECAAAFDVGAVEAGVGPFVGEGAVKSFDVAVGLASVGSGPSMRNAT